MVIVGVPRGTLGTQDVQYLAAQKVEIREYSVGKCDLSNGLSAAVVCAEDYPGLKLEWSRYLLMYDWLHKCDSCSGWAENTAWVLMAPDASKLLFQSGYLFEYWREGHAAQQDLLFLEESESNSKTNQTLKSMIECFGPNQARKMIRLPRWHLITLGVIFAAPSGVKRLIDVLRPEFQATVQLGAKCIAMSDQTLLNKVYQEDKFGVRAKSVQYGEGPALAVGTVCADQSSAHALRKDKSGFLLNQKGERSVVIYDADLCRESYAFGRSDNALSLVAAIEVNPGRHMIVPPPPPPPDSESVRLEQERTIRRQEGEQKCDNNVLLNPGENLNVKPDRKKSDPSRGAHKAQSKHINMLQGGWKERTRPACTLDDCSDGPELDFAFDDRKISVYVWNDGYHNKLREMELLAEGLVHHPAVQLVADPTKADLVLWPTYVCVIDRRCLASDWCLCGRVMANVESELIPIGCKNVVLLDFSDGCNVHPRSHNPQSAPCALFEVSVCLAATMSCATRKRTSKEAWF